jgi:hypothetical protein
MRPYGQPRVWKKHVRKYCVPAGRQRYRLVKTTIGKRTALENWMNEINRCAWHDTFGCPGGPAGDEFAAPVTVRCAARATVTRDWYNEVEGRTETDKLCDFHAELFDNIVAQEEERKRQITPRMCDDCQTRHAPVYPCNFEYDFVHRNKHP